MKNGWIVFQKLMVGKYIIEDLCGIPVDVEPASEFIYRRTITDKNTLVIGVSQSGETADTIVKGRNMRAPNMVLKNNTVITAFPFRDFFFAIS